MTVDRYDHLVSTGSQNYLRQMHDPCQPEIAVANASPKIISGSAAPSRMTKQNSEDKYTMLMIRGNQMKKEHTTTPIMRAQSMQPFAESHFLAKPQQESKTVFKRINSNQNQTDDQDQTKTELLPKDAPNKEASQDGSGNLVQLRTATQPSEDNKVVPSKVRADINTKQGEMAKKRFNSVD